MDSARGLVPAKVFDRGRLAWLADWLAVVLAISLPWSTSLTGIFAALWLIAVIPTLDAAAIRREVTSLAGGLPVLLWLLGVVGMLWADVPWNERLAGLSSFHKLLFIPLLLAHFRGSNRGKEVLLGFLASCTVLLAVSFLWWPEWVWWRVRSPGIPVKDYISQSAMFTICIFALLYGAADVWREGRRWLALALIWLALVFLANILSLATSRTALVVIPILLLTFGIVRFRWKGAVGSMAALCVVGAVAWPSAPYLQERVVNLFDEIRQYRSDGQSTSAGERLEFWSKSVGFIAAAPVIGHGTGSIPDQFRRTATGDAGMAALRPDNPHNQTLAVAIQLGLLGTIALWAMWIAHLMLFRRPSGLAAWVGLVIVGQNVIGSLFNSHLYDFTHGWLYVVGVGIAGGLVLANPQAASPESNSPA